MPLQPPPVSQWGSTDWNQLSNCMIRKYQYLKYDHSRAGNTDGISKYSLLSPCNERDKMFVRRLI